MSQYNFGTGQIFATPVGGGAALRIGALQDVSVDFNGEIKLLHGQYQFALDTARGKSKIEGKIGTANIDVEAYNRLYFGEEAVTAGQYVQVQNEAGVVPADAGPYTIAVANGGENVFFQDFGVYFTNSGAPLKQVSGVPADGEYSVDAAGTYTFNAAQADSPVLLNYMYFDSSTGGTLNITNRLMGDTPSFRLLASQVRKGKVFTICLYSVVADKLSLPLKQDDFVIPELNWSAQADETNRIGFLSTTSTTGGGA